MEPETGKALAAALDLLARRDHSSREIMVKLVRKGFSPSAVQEVLLKVAAAGYVDDAAFARRTAETMARLGKGFGPRLRMELRNKGIDAKAADDAVLRAGRLYPEEQSIRNLLHQKFSRCDFTDPRETRRIVSWFARRGFAPATVLRIMNRPEETL